MSNQEVLASLKDDFKTFFEGLISQMKEGVKEGIQEGSLQLTPAS